MPSGKQGTRAGVLLVLAVAAGGLFALRRVPAREGKALEVFEADMRRVRVAPPGRPPAPSQVDLDLALALYSIRLPRGLAAPRFDPDLEDRGLTTGTTVSGPQRVTIGPAAFSSWSLLGSTLAHEVEVHGRQNFFRIVFEDEFFGALTTWTRSSMALAGNVPDEGETGPLCAHCGTLGAEREAYEYEISQADRFGLTEEEVVLIRQVMETYYPLP